MFIHSALTYEVIEIDTTTQPAISYFDYPVWQPAISDALWHADEARYYHVAEIVANPFLVGGDVALYCERYEWQWNGNEWQSVCVASKYYAVEANMWL